MKEPIDETIKSIAIYGKGFNLYFAAHYLSNMFLSEESKNEIRIHVVEDMSLNEVFTPCHMDASVWQSFEITLENPLEFFFAANAVPCLAQKFDSFSSINPLGFYCLDCELLKGINIDSWAQSYQQAFERKMTPLLFSDFFFPHHIALEQNRLDLRPKGSGIQALLNFGLNFDTDGACSYLKALCEKKGVLFYQAQLRHLVQSENHHIKELHLSNNIILLPDLVLDASCFSSSPFVEPLEIKYDWGTRAWQNLKGFSAKLAYPNIFCSSPKLSHVLFSHQDALLQLIPSLDYVKVHYYCSSSKATAHAIEHFAQIIGDSRKIEIANSPDINAGQLKKAWQENYINLCSAFLPDFFGKQLGCLKDKLQQLTAGFPYKQVNPFLAKNYNHAIDFQQCANEDYYSFFFYLVSQQNCFQSELTPDFNEIKKDLQELLNYTCDHYGALKSKNSFSSFSALDYYFLCFGFKNSLLFSSPYFSTCTYELLKKSVGNEFDFFSKHLKGVPPVGELLKQIRSIRAYDVSSASTLLHQ